MFFIILLQVNTFAYELHLNIELIYCDTTNCNFEEDSVTDGDPPPNNDSGSNDDVKSVKPNNDSGSNGDDKRVKPNSDSGSNGDDKRVKPNSDSGSNWEDTRVKPNNDYGSNGDDIRVRPGTSFIDPKTTANQNTDNSTIGMIERQTLNIVAVLWASVTIGLIVIVMLIIKRYSM